MRVFTSVGTSRRGEVELEPEEQGGGGERGWWLGAWSAYRALVT